MNITERLPYISLMPLILPSVVPLEKFSPRVLRKWLKCVNWYSAAIRHPMQWQTESVNF